MDADKPDAPILQVVNADATPEEIAALVAVLLTPQSPVTPIRRAPSEWPVSNRLRRSLSPRSNGWRASSLPR
jgi:hypothetical protein